MRRGIDLRFWIYDLRIGMTRKRLQRDERRWLKRAGVGREFSGLGDLFCELHRAEQAPRCEGYSLQADSSWGQRTRRRVRRERWGRRARCVRRMGMYVLVYGGSLAVFLLVVHALWVVIKG